LAGFVPVFDPSFVALRRSKKEIEKVTKDFKVFVRKVAAKNSAVLAPSTLSPRPPSTIPDDGAPIRAEFTAVYFDRIYQAIDGELRG
jgi:hypothetical protein